MYKQVIKSRFIIYFIIALCTVSLGVIRVPITQLLINVIPNIDEITLASIYYIVIFFIGICYYIVGKMYNNILNSRKIKEDNFLDEKYKLIILGVVLFTEDILVLCVARIFRAVNFDAKYIMDFGVQHSLIFFINIIKFMVMASLVSWKQGIKNLIQHLSIFNKFNIIIIGVLLAIIAGIINYFLCMYTDLFAYAKERSDISSLFHSICMTLIYMYSIYINSKCSKK